MYKMNREEFTNTRRYVEKKALALMSHERKNSAVTGVPLENYRIFHKNGRVFYSVQNNTFKTIIDEDLIQAQQSSPDKFGTGEASDVIEALKAKVNNYVVKPFTAEILKSKIDAVLNSIRV